MVENFCSYEQALALKELGFDEPCLAYYEVSDKLKDNVRLKYIEHEEFNPAKQPFNNDCLAPLYQQAFRWFREKYNIKGHIEAVEYLDGTPDTYHWSIFNKCNSGYDQLTYEEAELECLKKLIEIVKNNN
jgi:hypothetical protein